MSGPAGDLLSHVTAADVIAFTGSAETAIKIRSNPSVLRHSTRVNVEADSLNIALLGPDATAGSPEFDLLVKEVVTEMTVKAGQKCTAIRRILVPRPVYAAVADAVTAKLAKMPVGNPRNESVRMGPVVSKAQQGAVMAGRARLMQDVTAFHGGDGVQLVDADPRIAAFVPPTLLGSEDAFRAASVHDVEVFGPVATLMPYNDLNHAVLIAERGGGSLVASIYTADTSIGQAMAECLAPSHGRVNIVSGQLGKSMTGHGNVMPHSLHGGPGRAGNGQELGGLRALRLYHQLVVWQGAKDVLLRASTEAVELPL